LKKNIFVACDFSNEDETVKLIEQIKNDIFGIKVGLQYITSTGIEGIKALSKFNLPIMYDAKAFDIKNTVSAFSKSLKNLGISYATVHILNSEETLKEAVKQAGNIKLIGVSILTSFSDNDLKKLGFSNNVEKQVEILIRIASSAGLYGVVCSPKEVKMVKKIAPNLVCFTPGVRLTSETHDQKRTMTPKEAIAQGADYLILGRALTSENPRENMRKIIQSLE
jgi:orotidine-5'-phosphate decarboxylase